MGVDSYRPWIDPICRQALELSAADRDPPACLAGNRREFGSTLPPAIDGKIFQVLF